MSRVINRPASNATEMESSVAISESSFSHKITGHSILLLLRHVKKSIRSFWACGILPESVPLKIKEEGPKSGQPLRTVALSPLPPPKPAQKAAPPEGSGVFRRSGRGPCVFLRLSCSNNPNRTLQSPFPFSRPPVQAVPPSCKPALPGEPAPLTSGFSFDRIIINREGLLSDKVAAFLANNTVTQKDRQTGRMSTVSHVRSGDPP